MDYSFQPTVNPWFSIWTRPRATLRHLLDSRTDVGQQVLLLAILNGIIESFNRAAGRSIGDKLPLGGIFLICFLFGAIGGLIGLYIGGALLSWMGRKLGGVGSAADVRVAMAWSYVPAIWGGILLVMEIGIYGKELFTSITPRIDASPVLALLLVGFLAIEIVIAIWSFIVFLKCLGEAHRFSAWRALGTSFLSFMLIALPILCLIGSIGVLTLLGRRV